MKGFFSRILSMVLCAAMVLGMVPGAFAAEAPEVPTAAVEETIVPETVSETPEEPADPAAEETPAETLPAVEETAAPCADGAHVWDEGVGSETVITYTCTLCGETREEAVIGTCAAHVWDEGVLTADSEEAPGVVTYTCTVCGAVREETQSPMTEPEEPLPVEGVSIDAVNFPDENFRNYVSGNFDSNANGILSAEEQASVFDISVDYQDITSLVGIEHFPALKTLYCAGNKLTSLDLSSNTALTTLSCSNNRFEILLDADGTYDLAELPGKFDAAKAGNWSNGTVEGTVFSIDLADTCQTDVTYSYDWGSTAWNATFTLAVRAVHTPGNKNTANYTQCGGGAVTDYYNCEICGRLCDETGAELRWDDVFKDGTGIHQADRNQVRQPDYTVCGGGWTIAYTFCETCGQQCSVEGTVLDFEKYYREGTGTHTPNLEHKLEADYTVCGGGWTVDHYLCSACNTLCLPNGTELDYGKHYQEGTGIHTPDLDRRQASNYTECGGGWTVDHYPCAECNQTCLSDGTTAYYDRYYKEGSGLHRPNSDQMYAADYTECGGGWTVDRYSCEICYTECLADGTVALYEQYYKQGNGRHTPDTSEKTEADYTACGGGWIVDRYPCKNCSRACLLDGAESDYEKYYQEGTGKHTPDLSSKQEADYTACGGGWTVAHYPCTACSRLCLANGTELDYEKHHQEGTGKHTPDLGRRREPDYTACGGGWTVAHYPCQACHGNCLEDGSELLQEQHYTEGSGQHTPNLDRIRRASYTECGGGWIVDRYPCEICYTECLADGTEAVYSRFYKQGNGQHTPDTAEKIEADYTKCGGGWIVTRYPCKVCPRDCLLDGSTPDYKTYHKAGNDQHTADLETKMEADYTTCGGGCVVERYLCKICDKTCLLDGSPLDYDKHYMEGDGKHTPGPEKPPTFIECGGGITGPYHECIYCRNVCDANGNEPSDGAGTWQPGSGIHSPGAILPPQEHPCGSIIKVPYGICIHCGDKCREDGRELEYPFDYSIGTAKHIPGETRRMYDSRCAGDTNDWYFIDYAYCTVCGGFCRPDGKEFAGEIFDPRASHLDLDGDSVCDRGGEYIYAVTGGNIYLDPESGCITDCDDQVTEADIPSRIYGVQVVGITRFAFQYAKTLRSVTLPDSLTSIAYSAFNGCIQLQSINFPEGLTSIGEHAFYECGLTGAVISNGVIRVESAAFSGCIDMRSVTIGTGVTGIGPIAFDRCRQLNEIKFLGDAPSIAVNTFNGVTATVYYPAGNGTWTEAVRQNYGGDLTWVPDTTQASAPVYRLYNPHTLEHLFTGSQSEYDALGAAGWVREGVAWHAPEEGAPVYRLYNAYTDGHFYTVSEAEKEKCVADGWIFDGVVSYSADPDSGAPIYRMFNPFEEKNYHHYTASGSERDALVSAGWVYEGVAWYAAGA